MFYSHTILARKSPLGTVWIAAHLERKIKKPQIDGIDIPSYAGPVRPSPPLPSLAQWRSFSSPAESIMFPEVPIALRLSGHLLLGLVRIYSWKVNYLFQDCNRMVTTIRTAFSSVQVDLPAGQDHAPFESITLPATLNLDDLDLDDVISQIKGYLYQVFTGKRKIIAIQAFNCLVAVADEREYVMIDLDEGAAVEPPITEPTETFPPISDDFGPSKNANNKIPVDPSPGDLAVNPNDEIQTDGPQNTPERMREATQEGLGFDFTDFIHGDETHMEVDPSPFVQRKEMSYLHGQLNHLHLTYKHHLKYKLRLKYKLHLKYKATERETYGTCGQLQYSTSMCSNSSGTYFVPNIYMKKQIAGDKLEKLVHKRRKLPQTALDMWRFSRTNRNDSFFLEPLLPDVLVSSIILTPNLPPSGMCSNLQATYERNYPHESNPDAESVSHEPEAGDGNDGGQDAPPERQLSPKSPENEDAPPEQQPSPKSPANEDAPREWQPSPKSPRTADAQPEPLSTPKSPEAGTARDDYTLPELPRFSPSATREDDSPFKTRSRTPPSRFGGTGGTERTPSDWNYSLPGQSTRSSHTMASLFPINEDDDLPEIPGLVSTPGGTSAGTGITGLGSMSARTRAVAQFFKDRISSDEQPGKFSLNGILEGRTRKQAARMFFETTVLKTYDYIDVRQEEPYGDIEVSVKPSLSTVKL
ncbi:hypothetical protein EJB05_55911, partial [Eragrostis curvula]